MEIIVSTRLASPDPQPEGWFKFGDIADPIAVLAGKAVEVLAVAAGGGRTALGVRS